MNTTASTELEFTTIERAKLADLFERIKTLEILANHLQGECDSLAAKNAELIRDHMERL